MPLKPPQTDSDTITRSVAFCFHTHSALVSKQNRNTGGVVSSFSRGGVFQAEVERSCLYSCTQLYA